MYGVAPYNQNVATNHVVCASRVWAGQPSLFPKQAYEKKYGTQAERAATREAQAGAQAKTRAGRSRESLQWEEEEQLKEVIKASLHQVRRVVGIW